MRRIGIGGSKRLLPLLARHHSRIADFVPGNTSAEEGRYADRKKSHQRQARHALVGDPVQLLLQCELGLELHMKIGYQALYAAHSHLLVRPHSAIKAMVQIELMPALIAPHVLKAQSLAGVIGHVEKATCQGLRFRLEHSLAILRWIWLRPVALYENGVATIPGTRVVIASTSLPERHGAEVGPFWPRQDFPALLL